MPAWCGQERIALWGLSVTLVLLDPATLFNPKSRKCWPALASEPLPGFVSPNPTGPTREQHLVGFCALCMLGLGRLTIRLEIWPVASRTSRLGSGLLRLLPPPSLPFPGCGPLLPGMHHLTVLRLPCARYTPLCQPGRNGARKHLQLHITNRLQSSNPCGESWAIYGRDGRDGSPSLDFNFSQEFLKWPPILPALGFAFAFPLPPLGHTMEETLRHWRGVC